MTQGIFQKPSMAQCFIPAAGGAEERNEEGSAGDGVGLGLGEMFSFRCLAGRRCLGGGRGRLPGPCLESNEDDEDERERERIPIEKNRIKQVKNI